MESGPPNMGLLQSNARHLTISASHWSLCSRTATCAREQITAAKRVWGRGGLSATFPQPLSDPTAAADAHAHVEQPKTQASISLTAYSVYIYSGW
ncbi:hypothetical protein HaLaN_04134, partial [Haematococcus lacustris]